MAEALQVLQEMGLGVASLNQGYGHAFDLVVDAVIGSFEAINLPLRQMLTR
ncbi:hypothetical protein [Hylemonella gracilis]|uniref:hypothetical protein n=1 Tax=Hylemonella gracilis TaxID=80880 RepID=UPI0012DCC962|nr:hypothetical protein [Hylemonella gracilis]